MSSFHFEWAVHRAGYVAGHGAIMVRLRGGQAGRQGRSSKEEGGGFLRGAWPTELSC